MKQEGRLEDRTSQHMVNSYEKHLTDTLWSDVTMIWSWSANKSSLYAHGYRALL